MTVALSPFKTEQNQENFMNNILYLYFLIISLASITMCCCDKAFAQKGMRRISEKALFGVSIFGGAIFMYFTMRMIRHKTKHKRFMIGLPIIIFLQLTMPFLIRLLIYKS